MKVGKGKKKRKSDKHMQDTHFFKIINCFCKGGRVW